MRGSIRSSPRSRSSSTCSSGGQNTRRCGTRFRSPAYHIREAGATAAQELAFTLANGFTYVERGVARGLDIDSFAARLSFFWTFTTTSSRDRQVARRAPDLGPAHARALQSETGALLDDAVPQPNGRVTLTAQTAAQQHRARRVSGARGSPGGTQSLHTNSLDETLALPTEQSVQVALRTQQILAHETGVAEVIDPLVAHISSKRSRISSSAKPKALFAEISSIGGVVRGSESGWFQRQIAQSAAAFQRQIELGEKVIVGVNEFLSEDDHPVEILKVSNDAEEEQRRRLARVRAERDNAWSSGGSKPSVRRRSRIKT